VARALIEAGWAQPERLHKLYYLGPMFRYDRPQAGRYRQFHQWGAEAVGTESPSADVETILLLVDFLEAMGLRGLVVKLNSVGDATCRPAYQERIREILEPKRAALCPDCQERLDRNPLRVFDCKVPSCREIVKHVPPMIESLCEACRVHLGQVERELEAAGARYEMDPGLVRGLDYYTRTAYEVHYGALGAQSALGGGGRYDGLIHLLGGADVPAVGFSLGIERTLLALGEEKTVPVIPSAAVFLARGPGLASEAMRLARTLRRRFEVLVDLEERGLGAQLKQADRLDARVAVILGEDEARAGEITLKDLASGDQRRVPLARLEQELEAALALAPTPGARH
jgi:histidyl-tRNA synthetase